MVVTAMAFPLIDYEGGHFESVNAPDYLAMLPPVWQCCQLS